MNPPPFKQGIAARKRGEARTANPFPRELVEGDGYPGPWVNWDAGWAHEDNCQRFDKYVLKVA